MRIDWRWASAPISTATGCLLPAIAPPSHFTPEPAAITQSRPGVALAWAPLAVSTVDLVSPIGQKAAVDAGFQETTSSWSADFGLWGRSIPLPRSVGAIRLGGRVGGGGLDPTYDMWGVLNAGAGIVGQIGWLESDGTIRTRGAVGVEAVAPFERALVAHRTVGWEVKPTSVSVWSVPALWWHLDAARTFPLGRDSGLEVGGAWYFATLPGFVIALPTVSLGARL